MNHVVNQPDHVRSNSKFVKHWLATKITSPNSLMFLTANISHYIVPNLMYFVASYYLL